MKKNINLIMAVLCAALLFVGCGKEKTANAPKSDYADRIVGEWHCAPEGYDVDVYVAFDAAGSFEEYQRLGEGRYRRFEGSWSVEKDVLSGVYADGTKWGSAYTLSFEGNTMTLTANNESAEAIVYTKCEIPAEVKSEAIDPLGSETRAEEIGWF